MSDETMPTPNSNTPTSWRDVYALVQDSEKRLTQTITEGFARQASVSQDHEVRLRIVESGVSAGSLAMNSAMRQGETMMQDWQNWRNQISNDVSTIQRADAISGARSAGMVVALTGAKAAVLMVVAVVSPLIAVVAVVIK